MEKFYKGDPGRTDKNRRNKEMEKEGSS